jgi:enoyl-CoA hydratase
MTAVRVSRVDPAGRIALVTLDRPPVNALDRATIADLTTVFRGFGGERQTSVAVLTAEGDRAFCAGIDLQEPQTLRGGPGSTVDDPADQLDAGRPIRDMFWSIFDCAVPVIGAVNGPAVGAGLAMAAVCDTVIAAETATFSVTEIDVGRLGAYRHLCRMVGPFRARRMFFTGERVSPHELASLGAVDSVVSRADVVPVAIDLATRIADKSPIALRLAKEAMNRVEFLDLRDAYRLEQDYTNRLRTYEDAAEAAAAQAEHRQARWGWR